jgi:hypothetical protein
VVDKKWLGLIFRGFFEMALELLWSKGDIFEKAEENKVC